MVVSSSSSPAFVPAERPILVVAADGTLAAIHEPSRINIVELPSCAQFAELGTDSQATATDVAWLGTPPRLVVLARHATHSAVHLVDPLGPRVVNEIRLEAGMRLVSAVGAHALVVGPSSVAILAATDKALTPYQFPARAIPVAAGAAGAQFVVALSGTIEEWDPQSRMPKRRLKLPRPAHITAVGGSDRVVWITTQQEPARLDVIPLVNRGQPKAHDLPEPIASIASHPRSDVVACIGASSGRIYVIDLDGRTGLRIVGPSGIDRTESLALVIGRVGGILAAQARRALTLVTIDRTDATDPRGEEALSPTPREDRGSSDAAERASTLFGPSDAELEALAAAAKPPSDSQRLARIASPPPFSDKLQPPTALNDKLQPPASGGLFATGATPNPFAPTAAANPFAPTPSRPPAPPGRSAPPPPRASADTLASAIAPPATDARATEDTMPPPTTPPADAPSAAIGGPGRPDDSRRATSETIPVASFSDPRGGDSGRHARDDDEQRVSFRSFRERLARARTAEPVPVLWGDLPATWRDELVSWAQNARTTNERESPPASAVDLLAVRLDLSVALGAVVSRLYAEHLLGNDGMAPVDVARILDGGGGEGAGQGWAEALGRGELAARGLATYERSRVRLADVIRRALDEVTPSTGTLVGTPGSVTLLGACAIVAAGPLSIIAQACLSSVGGAILAAHVDADPGELVAEARAYGAAPLWRVRADGLSRIPPEQPIILAVDDDATADLLGVPRLT